MGGWGQLEELMVVLMLKSGGREEKKIPLCQNYYNSLIFLGLALLFFVACGASTSLQIFNT